VIGTGPTLPAEGFDSSGRLLEMGINQIYGTCTDLYDDDIIPSVMLCAGVPDGGEKRSEWTFRESGKCNKRYRIDLAWSCSDASNRPCKVVPTYALNQGPLVF
jgi:hypothetical protein